MKIQYLKAYGSFQFLIVSDNPPLWKGKEDLTTGPSSIKSNSGMHRYTKLVPREVNTQLFLFVPYFLRISGR